MIHHLVLLRFRRDVPPKEIDAAFALLAGLKKTIPGLTSFTGGPYSSPEGLNRGYTHGFVMTFRDAPSRDGYLDHPEHVKVKERVGALLEGGLDGVVAFDFEA
jgi:stress responsive alpha/beta barrel protein